MVSAGRRTFREDIRGEGVSHAVTWGKEQPTQGKRKCKCSRVEAHSPSEGPGLLHWVSKGGAAGRPFAKAWALNLCLCEMGRS